MDANGTGPRTISVAEAARLLGVAPRTYRKAARAGTVPVLKIASAWVVPVAPLMRMLGEHDEDDEV